eukprot:UN05919
MLTFRLAPQDYHRYHIPITGRVIAGYEAGSNLHSVNFDAMTSENLAIYNKRFVLFIESEDYDFTIAHIIIGAACVGSVNLCADPGNHAYNDEGEKTWENTLCSSDPDYLDFDKCTTYEYADQSGIMTDDDCTFKKGADIGFFAFGGSTIVTLFPKDIVDIEP